MRLYEAGTSRRQRAWMMAAAGGMILLAMALTMVALSQVGIANAAPGTMTRDQAIAAAKGEIAASPMADDPVADVAAPPIEDDAPRAGAFRVNLNTATPEQLERVPGLGKTKVKAIVAWRQSHPFVVTADVMKVKGFGQKTYEKLKGFLAVDGPPSVGTPPQRPSPVRRRDKVG